MRIIYLREGSGSLFMVADTVVLCYTKKFAESGQGHFRVVPKRKARSQDDT